VHLGLIGPHGPDDFQDNIGDSLLRGGHEVTFLGTTHPRLPNQAAANAALTVLKGWPELERRFHHRLVRTAIERECDAVITTQADLSHHAVTALRRARIPVALWFPDSVGNLGRQQMLAAPYTALFFKEPVLVQRLRDTLGLPTWYLPEACNPRWHRPVGEAASTPAIAVAGTPYPGRLMLLRRLHKAGIPLVVYGPPVPRWSPHPLPLGLHAGRPVFREEKSRVFRTAAGVLNDPRPSEIHGVNARLFEATAAGGAVLCERRQVLGDLYALDHEVLPYGTFTRLVELARWLLADPRLTRDIGDAASKRAHAEHSYDDRLPLILEKLA
jgi:spore maturation protein CgeB